MCPAASPRRPQGAAPCRQHFLDSFKDCANVGVRTHFPLGPLDKSPSDDVRSQAVAERQTLPARSTSSTAAG